MKPDLRRLAVLAAAAAVALCPGQAGAIPNPFKKKNKGLTSIPSGDAMRTAEIEAAGLLAAARNEEAAGHDRAAMAGYRKIVSTYPYTSLAPAAQFRIAAAHEKEGKYEKAFEAYQDLVTSYRQTPQFAEAIDRQFGIAMQSRTEKTGRTLFIKSHIDPDAIVEMLTKVIASAPQGTHAAEAQFEIARIHEEESKPDQAIAAYRKVVENYPRSPLAAEAQSRIGQTYLAKVSDGSRDQSNLVRAREATEEAQGLFGGSAPGMNSVESTIDDAAAENAFRTGKFYQKKGNYRAAMIYYSALLKRPGAPHYEEVRDRVNDMSSRDPKLMDSVKSLALDSRSLAVPAAADLKGKPGYFGPPGPVPQVAAGVGGVPKAPAMRSDYVPYAPLEPGELPSTPGTPDSSLLDPSSLPPPETAVPEAAPAVPAEAAPEEKEKSGDKPAAAPGTGPAPEEEVKPAIPVEPAPASN